MKIQSILLKIQKIKLDSMEMFQKVADGEIMKQRPRDSFHEVS